MAFEREVWQAFITNNSGDVQPNAQITVFDAGTSNLSTIYSGLTGAPRPNPFNTGSDGLAKFYAEPARYRVQAQTPDGIAVFDDVDLSQKALRSDLADSGSPVQIGGQQASRLTFNIDSIKDLGVAPKVNGRQYSVKGFYAGSDVGGGMFYWDADLDATNHNGVTVINPVKVSNWNGESSGLETYFSPISDTGCFVRINYQRITPEMCGAKEGYDLYNHIALEHLAKQDWSADWGNKEYGVSSEIGNTTKLGAMDWISSGCKIYVELGSTPIYRVMHFNLLPLSHRLQGKLIVDGNLLANNGVLFDNPSSGYGELYLDGLEAKNIRRRSGLNQTTGITVRGAWHSVVIRNPVSTDVYMPAGTGNSGSQGVSGIAISRLNDRSANYVLITNPRVENIQSEDLDYVVDQDGIVIFDALPGELVQPRFDIEGGVLKNCFGRFIKSQAGGGTVRGVTFELTESANSSVSGVGAQAGCVNMYDCVYNIHGDARGGAIIENRGDSGKRNTSFTVQNVEINNLSTNVISTAFATSGNGPVHNARFKDVSIKGPVDIPFNIRTKTADTVVSIENFYADDIRGDFIAQVRQQGTYTDPDSPILNGTIIPISYHNIINKGDSVYLTASTITGFTARSSTRTSGLLEGINLITTAEAASLSGTLDAQGDNVLRISGGTRAFNSFVIGDEGFADGLIRHNLTGHYFALPGNGEITIPTPCGYPRCALVEIFGYRGNYAKLIKNNTTLIELQTNNASVENDPNEPGSGWWVVRPDPNDSQQIIVQNRSDLDDRFAVTVIAR